jgi:ectoine hydroxylase-related dioxygenase (phytanoyl-CoA dioxygenase family)
VVLSTEQRAGFERDGYLIFDPDLDSEIFDRIIAFLADKYRSDGPEINVAYRDPNRIQDAWRVSGDIKAIARAPRILAALDQLYGRKPLPFQTLNFPKGTEQKAHADAIHFNSMPPTFMCGVWVALEDVDMNNGPLVYYPGSHKLPEVTVAKLLRANESLAQKLKRILGRADSVDLYPLYEQHVAAVIERENLVPLYATIKKGQALIWAANLLHGGAIQHDKTRTRHSQVTHYFFENCRYYTPILSRQKQIAWRDPLWIG